MAEPWALRHKFLKKRVYTALVEGRNLRRASCLHALSRPEIDHLRSLAPKVPICLVPNGVDPTPFDELPARSLLESTHPELINKFIILFLGRLHVKKGLDLLAQAVARVVHHHPNLHLLIAGADEGAKSPLVQLAQYLGIADRLTFLGHVAGESARLAWGAADAFVLPSYSEGFSMAVLEALAARLPVVITDSCHFPELAAADGGITAPPTPEGITQALRNLLERSPEERAALAARGRALVESRYTWNRQAERLAQVYNWLLEGGPAPDVVIEPA
jgi:glycosyltransferase involved in cell wall biosynthesis